MSDRLVQRLLGGRPEPGTERLLATLGLGVSGVYAFYSLVAIWAIERLGLREADVGLVLLGAAVFSMTGGLVGGRISDRVGRKPVILVVGSLQVLLPALLLVPGLGVPGAIAVLVLFALVQPARGAAQGALLADLVPDERREVAFGTFRIVLNVGALAGQLLGAVLVSVSWHAWIVGVSTLYALSLVAALGLPSLPPARAAGGNDVSLGTLARDRLFALIFVAAIGAALVYNAFETVLPVSLTQSHGYPPAAWGVLFAVNPILVMLFQLRVTRWGTRIAPGPRLALALALMGASFLPLTLTAAPPVLLVMLVVFVFGEMLWSPTADALVARTAPTGARGAYIGTLGVATWSGGALAPALGLRVRDAAGDAVLWLSVAAVALASGALYAAAARRQAGTERAAPALAEGT